MYINKIDTMFQINPINDRIKIWVLFLNLQIYKKSSVVKQTIEYVVSFYEKKRQKPNMLLSYDILCGGGDSNPYALRH